MTGEELKADLQRIDPADYAAYCVNHGVAGFLLPALNEDGTDSETEDIEWSMRQLPPVMHCVLREFGSIYMVGPDPTRDKLTKTPCLQCDGTGHTQNGFQDCRGCKGTGQL